MTARLTLRTDRTLVRAGAPSRRVVVATLVAPPSAERTARPPLDLALVLDHSGSMADASKLCLAKAAIRQALALLDEGDRVSLVVFDDEVTVLAPLAPATPAHRQAALTALAAVEPRGCTNLSGGWLRGCEQLAAQLDLGLGAPPRAALSRCIVLTDGLANRGITDREALATHARALHERGIVTTTFGVGADFDEFLLRDMARAGGGSFQYIATPTAIPAMLARELDEALTVTLRAAVLQLDAQAGMRLQVLNAFESSTAGRGTTIALGDLAGGQELEIVLAVDFPRGEIGATIALEGALRGDGAIVATARCEWRFDTHAANDEQPRDLTVREAAGLLELARARDEALRRNRAGDYAGAEVVLLRSLEAFAADATASPVLAEALQDASREAREVAAPLDPRRSKELLFASESVARSRDASGGQRRRD